MEALLQRDFATFARRNVLRCAMHLLGFAIWIIHTLMILASHLGVRLLSRVALSDDQAATEIGQIPGRARGLEDILRFFAAAGFISLGTKSPYERSKVLFLLPPQVCHEHVLIDGHDDDPWGGLDFAFLALFLQPTLGHPLNESRRSAEEPDPSFAVSVQLAGQTFVNKGLVAFGLIPSNFTESTGDTLGGIGSAIALKRDSFLQRSDGTFAGTFIVQPDRGFNVDGTIDYQARQHQIDFVLSPYYSANNLSFDDALNTLQLTYRDTLLYFERHMTKTSGLDALAVRAQQWGFPLVPDADPQMPIASTNYDHLTVDAEGLVLNADGTFWVSEEYGPYIYLMSPNEENGALNFTSATDPATGRAGNQGFEGLTADPSGTTLYALLQSATIQDGGNNKSTSRYTRLLAYDISDPLVARPMLVGEFVVPLPQSKKGKTRAASELHFVSDDIFLVLSRDGDGHGGSSDKSSYKQADLLDISTATDIHATKFDDPRNPIATNGTLDGSITPGTYVSFVSFIDDTQLARFGLHNGKPADQTLIDAKWESLALASCRDPEFPQDFFLFTAADNDFLSTQGVALGVPFDAGIDNDNQFMVFRVTLPTASGAIY
ncbi:hypothetical protein A0H81_01866 [Grifola frondosa]|uniref:Phytase-like domain-containing protein n=1 Tax=Grifola frondosa TaxID=5627 RepID=A0A1C7MM80_GRIFR|nr:hypothetical protein A0H81_01866 [Grifola frondosa]